MIPAWNRFQPAFVALLVIALASFIGCDQAPAPLGSGPSAPAALDELRLGYFPNLTHAQAVLGTSSGEFQSAIGSTKFKPKRFNAGPELIQALNSGAIDIGYVGPGPALSDHVAGHGQAIRVISGAAANGVVIVAGKDSGIQSMKDLIGKKLATPQLYNSQDISARHYMKAILGVEPANVLPVPNSQQSGMMTRGNIDAAWVPEPWGARLISETGARLIGEEKDQWPDQEFALTVIVTTPKFLADHPDIVEKILAVSHHWTQRLNQNPAAYRDQLNSTLASLAGKALPADVLDAAMQRTKFTDDALPDTFKTMGQWSYDLGIVKEAPNLNGLFETDIMQRLSKIEPTTRP